MPGPHVADEDVGTAPLRSRAPPRPAERSRCGAREPTTTATWTTQRASLDITANAYLLAVCGLSAVFHTCFRCQLRSRDGVQWSAFELDLVRAASNRSSENSIQSPKTVCGCRLALACTCVAILLTFLGLWLGFILRAYWRVSQKNYADHRIGNISIRLQASSGQHVAGLTCR